MAKKKSTASSPEVKTPELCVTLADAEQQLRKRVEKGREILALSPKDPKSLTEARERYYTWDEYNTALLSRIFSTEDLSREYSFWGIAVVGKQSMAEEIREFSDDVSSKVRRLESIIQRLPLYTPHRGMAEINMPSTAPNSSSRKVFVVHGRNDALKEAVARYLTQLDLKPIILHEQANAGHTIIEKFEANSDACYSVILLTPDDAAGLAPPTSLNDLQPRARQNVVFEWGFLVGKLGRKNVCALVVEGVELPSDVHGIVYVSIDQYGAWKMLLARELKAGGVEVDLNRAI